MRKSHGFDLRKVGRYTLCINYQVTRLLVSYPLPRSPLRGASSNALISYPDLTRACTDRGRSGYEIDNTPLNWGGTLRDDPNRCKGATRKIHKQDSVLLTSTCLKALMKVQIRYFHM